MFYSIEQLYKKLFVLPTIRLNLLSDPAKQPTLNLVEPSKGKPSQSDPSELTRYILFRDRSDNPILTSEENESDIVRTAGELEAVYDIPVQVSAVLGKSRMQVSNLMKLGRGAVVELDRKVGEAIDIYVNNRLVARGEVVVVDERLGITMTEIIKTDRH